MTRIFGSILVVIAAMSLLASGWGLFQLWTMRQPVVDAAAAGIDLFAETLDTTSQALTVTSASLQTASQALSTVEGASLSVAQTMSTTRTTVGSFSTLIGRDLPTSIGATRTALKSAQASAVVADNVLATLSRIPFINIQYDPAVPLSVALGDVATSMDNLPPSFSAIARNLDTTSESLDTVVASLNEMPTLAAQGQRNIADAEQVVTRYQGEVVGLQKLIQPIKAWIPMAMTGLLVGLTFLMFWLGVTEVQVLLKGLEVVRGGHKT
jgi:hypothetical protein